MDASSSDISSDSSDSDSPSADATPAQIVQSAPARESQSSAHANEAPVDLDDSDSDMSMSADTSDDEDNEVPSTSATRMNHIGLPLEQPISLKTTNVFMDPSNKRKYEDSTEDTTPGPAANGVHGEIRKRLKSDEEVPDLGARECHLGQDKSLLPAEIWHHIFTFIPPRTLGLLLQVNRCFHAYLDPSSSKSSPISLPRSAVQLLKADAIWRASRVLFRPGMPAPLKGKTELDMWNLACSFSCQFCGKKQKSVPQPPIDQWLPGPGENGNVPIWSFGMRSCGVCLQQRSSKEIDLLLSSSIPSVLMPALPFVFFTNELHILPQTTLQNAQPPSSIQITKHFYQRQIEEIKSEFFQVQSLGTAAAEEWIKGLEERGKAWRSDAGRWEKWELSGGVARMRGLEPHEAVKSTVPTRTITPATTDKTTHNLYPTIGPNTDSQQNLMQSQKIPQPIQTTFPTKPPARFDSPAQNGFGAYSRPSLPSRHERTKGEVAELKAARRAEIERRCMELDPPLTAGVLAHMGSFQAAIQIIQPLDNGAWEVLKPRLLSQRQDAEQRENGRLAQSRVVQEHLDEQNRYQNVNVPPESKDILDREWDDVQAPFRSRLGGYADEIIRDGWNDGEKVSRDNCATFAAEVLIYVRKRFYAEVAKDEAAVRATGREPEADPPFGPYTRKLILENMKWVFDTKIKPCTEQYRKELFLCNDCENKSKYYGFEGVIQHYAAKHTNALSLGSIVVHWKAEWPEYPPFDPEPANASAKNGYYAAAPSASAQYTATAPQQNFSYGGYQPVPVSAPLQVPNLHVYQESPGPYYGHPQYGESYSGHQNGPYAPPPQGYADNSGGYPAPYSAPPQVGSMPGYSEPLQDYAQQGYAGTYPTSTQGMYASPHPGSLYPIAAPELPPQQQAYTQEGGQYGYSYNQPEPQPTHPNHQFTPAALKTEEYKAQLQDVARNARAVWDSINNLKDVAGSVKVYTMIYHILQRSRHKFEEDPTLSMIVDGLSNNKDMRKVRNINGLMCRACSLGLPGATSFSAKRHYSFPQLANHFLKEHEQAASQSILPIPDWTKDMVKLPDFTQSNPITKSRGLDDKKLKLIAEALPEIFLAQKSRTERVEHAGPNRAYASAPNQDPYDLAPSLDNHDKYYTAVDSERPSEAGGGTYDSGQYDPRYPGDLRGQEIPADPEPRSRVIRRTHDYQEPLYAERERFGYEERPVSPPHLVRAADSYGHLVVREEAPVFLDRPIRYRNEPEVQYRVRREPPALTYQDSDGRDHRLDNNRSHHSNRHQSPLPLSQEAPQREIRYLPTEESAARQSRNFEVAAQILQSAQQARGNQPIKDEPTEGGSEDGELRTLPPHPNVENGRSNKYTEASNAAELFLDNFQPGESSQTPNKVEGSDPRQDAQSRPSWKTEQIDDHSQRRYDLPGEPQRRARSARDEVERVIPSRRRIIDENPGHNEYVVHERAPAPRESRAYANDERYVSSGPEHAATRERSPELVDRRYKLNDVVYRDERVHRTPSRYARYESVRLENDRARSRSPVYVRMGPQSAQYRERSPGAQPLHQEPIYRSPQVPAEEVAYERAPPRQEYYRVYPDEPRQRPQYVETFEYVQVSDPNGDYMIRRPVRREREREREWEPEQIYARYDAERYGRQPIYETRETRAAVSRADPAYYEEYDPRNPAPPPAEVAPVRQREARYQ